MSVDQQSFVDALLDPARPVPPGLSDGAARPAGRRFGVYRNNVAVSLTEAIHLAFPVIAKLLGRENMDGLAGMFLRAHPPGTRMLMQYGDAFPDFLADMPQLAHLGYLPDMARLELALRRSYHAADAEPAATETLTGDAETLARSRIVFAPALQVVRSRWPIFDIWRFNTEDGAPQPSAQAQDVLITRPEFDPVPQPLPDGGADWLAALARGDSVADALDAVLADAPGFDPAPTLTLLLRGGAITALRPGQ